MSVDETQRLWERSEENNGHTSVQPATSDSSEKVIELDTVPKASTDVPKEDAVITPRRREASPPRTAPSRDSEIKHDDPFLTKKSSPISAGLENDPFLTNARSVKSESRNHRERVLVRIYDLGKTFVTRGAWNSVTRSYGAFHSGVQVYGREWSFGMTLDDVSTGVTWNPPGKNEDHSFRETISMGYTSMSRDEVGRLIYDMSREWLGCKYNMLTRNCHSFADEFCRSLGVGQIPSWVNDLATSGAAAVELWEAQSFGPHRSCGIANLSYDAFTYVGQGLGLTSVSSTGDPQDGDCHDPFSVLRRG